MVAAAVSATMASWLLPSDRKRSKNNTTKTKPNEKDNPKHYTKSFFWSLYNNNHHNNHHHHDDHNHDHHDNNKPNALGILAFDAAKTMSNLISLHRSFSDAEIARLKRDVVASRGVAYLNSDEESFLLALACAERLEDLDRAANSVTRLGSRCADGSLSRFNLVYSDLKLGHADVDKIYSSSTRELEKSLEKTERRILATSNLYAELEALAQLEASERRLNEWKKNGASAAGATSEAASVEAFEAKIAAQRKLVRQLKEGSLWAQSFDKTVGLAARVICVVFARMCAHFGPYVDVLPHVKCTSRTRSCKGERFGCPVDVLDKLFGDPELLRESHSGPIMGSGPGSFGLTNNSKANLVRFMSRDSSVFVSEQAGGFEGARATAGIGGCGVFSLRPRNKVFQAASPSTVGGSGLAVRYANIITLVEKYMRSNYMVGEQARKELYDMLPGSLCAQVRSKLNKSWRHVEVDEARRSGAGVELAMGWREAVEEILQWLGPMARDTLTWQNERSLETQCFVDAQPTVLLMQTLHFSDVEKTEAAVAQVLVGLSCIYRYENRLIVNGDADDVDDS